MLYFGFELEAARDGVNKSLRFQLMCDLLRAHPLVAGDDDGEDSTGRQKIRLQKAGEVVNRAADIADLAVQIGESNGWLKAVTISPEDVRKRIGELDAITWDAKLGPRGLGRKTKDDDQPKTDQPQ